MQNIYCEFGAINKMAQIIKDNKIENLLIVTDERLYAPCGAEKSLSSILEKIKFGKFTDFEINPKIEDIQKGIEIQQKGKFDGILAIGGGSVIDIAKAINILAAQEGPPEEYIKARLKISRKGLPLIAAPTTSGTGSEATHFAVVYIDKIKYSLADHRILPDYALVDPNFTMALPKNITAATGFDALAQGIESYWAVGASEESLSYAEQAIKLSLTNLEQAVNNPDKTSRLAMARAANFAGRAINIGKTTAPHALSYYLTSYFNIPHGHAVGITLGNFIHYNSMISESDCNHPKGVNWVRGNIRRLLEIMGKPSTESARDMLYSLMDKIELETDIEKLGFNFQKDLTPFVESINMERLSNNPRKLDSRDVEKLLRRPN